MHHLVDTHCHIHDPEFFDDPEGVYEGAVKSGIGELICVGTTASDSELAVTFAQGHDHCYASIGLHPHDAKLPGEELDRLGELAGEPKVVAVGECGLDYYYENSPKEAQQAAFRKQIELAQEHDLPMIFHVREAFDDFLGIFDEYSGITGVVHSFTADKAVLGKVLERGLYVGLNGIMTFTKDQDQLEAAKAVPLDRLLLETDAPFLTPSPKRGTVNVPNNVRLTMEFLSRLRLETLEALATITTENAKRLFNLSEA